MGESEALAPIATTVLYEDDEIRIWDQRLDPGQHLAKHRHECDYVLIDIRGDRLEADILPGSTGEHEGHFELNVRRGKTYFIKKGGLEVADNTGELPYRGILVEYKQDAEPA